MAGMPTPKHATTMCQPRDSAICIRAAARSAAVAARTTSAAMRDPAPAGAQLADATTGTDPTGTGGTPARRSDRAFVPAYARRCDLLMVTAGPIVGNGIDALRTRMPPVQACDLQTSEPRSPGQTRPRRAGGQVERAADHRQQVRVHGRFLPFGSGRAWRRCPGDRLAGRG